MLDFINPKIIAVAQILTSIGIIHFWITWFRKEHNEPWLPPGYVAHERCFVYSDSVMSVLLVTAAVLLFLGHERGESLTLVCGGMMLFLTILDTVYFLQNDMFDKDKGRSENLGVVVPTAIMSVVMILRFI